MSALDLSFLQGSLGFPGQLLDQNGARPPSNDRFTNEKETKEIAQKQKTALFVDEEVEDIDTVHAAETLQEASVITFSRGSLVSSPASQLSQTNVYTSNTLGDDSATIYRILPSISIKTEKEQKEFLYQLSQVYSNAMEVFQSRFNNNAQREASPCPLVEYATQPSKQTYSFVPYAYDSIRQRLGRSTFQMTLLDGKAILQINNYLNREEGEDARKLIQFNRPTKDVGTSVSARNEGEKPAKIWTEAQCLNLLMNAPLLLDSMHKLFAYTAEKMNVYVSTLPWCTHTSALANNYLTEVNEKSASLGWHQDYVTLNNTYPMPKIYRPGHYEEAFENGAQGKPYYLTALAYVTESNFNPDWGMSTSFQDGAKRTAATIKCEHLKVAIFDGEITHRIDSSNIPEGINTWRNTFAWRIAFLPKSDQTPSIRLLFQQFIKSMQG